MRARIVTLPLLMGLALSAGVLLGSGTTYADPALRESESATLTCGNDTYNITTARGNGAFTPAMDLDSSVVFIPVAFGPGSGEVRDLETGELIEEFSDNSSVSKGNGKAARGNKQLLYCTYLFEFVNEDEGVYGYFQGEVTGFASGRR